MPEPAPTIHDTTDLERQVGDLLEEMQTSTQRLADEVKAAVPGVNGSAATAGPVGVPEAAVDAELTRAATSLAEKPAEAAPTPPAEASAATAPTPEPDLAAAVEKLIDSAAAPGPAAPAPEAGGGVKTLDAKLAGLADELIAGEFEDEATVLKGERPAPPPIVEIAAAPAPKAEPVAPAAPVDAALLPPPEEPAKPTPKEPADVAPVVLAAARGEPKSGSLVQTLLATMSAPLSDKPHLRDILGWVALVQAFMAMCVWVWVLFVRSDLPVDPPPVPAAKEQAQEGHTPDKPAKGGHEAPKAKAAKKAVKKTSHASSSGGH